MLHWIGGLQVELVNSGSDSLQIEKIYRSRHNLSKLEWIQFLQSELTEAKKAELLEIKDRIKLQGRPYNPKLDEEYWKVKVSQN
ncbi:hypothetical protein RT41_GL000005 [Lactococcus fujiensis JCM 16395]|uniref:Uncharacterized protein n=1 Tax=Lactococcus fujiensis JCM 16395 TaxID=1291764 RepID=A0A2A5RP83_9LACT|nr:hypothetical protein RT41_GL000005 [Lactococcus fujiensis JCM 16395]